MLRESYSVLGQAQIEASVVSFGLVLREHLYRNEVQRS